ncbi:MAG: PIN domain-containing protein [Vicinamibacterales bacterium]
MSGGSFLDSNILVYTDDAADAGKQAAAIALVSDVMRTRTGVVSLQVLQEYFAVVTRKLGVDAAAARAKVELLGAFSTVPVDIDDVLAAIDLHRLHQVSIWDGLIIRAAQQARCARIYSEDLQHGRRFDSVEIVNPFLALGRAPRRKRPSSPKNPASD